jgi:RNA polymerase sigma factor (sigma-70 family)
MSSNLLERAKSVKQQRLFGMARAVQKGKLKPSEVSPAVRKLARLSPKKVNDFAKTKHDKLPEVKESLRALLEELGISADEVLEKYGQLAYWIAHRFAEKNVELDVEDLKQEAVIALLKAAREYSPEHGKFESYASQAIRNHLGKIAWYAGSYVYQGKRSPHYMPKVELDAPMGSGEDDDEDETLYAKLPSDQESPADYVDRQQRYAWAKSELEKLSPREQQLLTAWANGKTYDELGRMIGLTKMGAYRIVQNALEKLRATLRESLAEQRRVARLVNMLLESEEVEASEANETSEASEA